MSNRKEFAIKCYIYILGGIALLSCIISTFDGEYPFILETKPFIVWCIMLLMGIIIDGKKTYECFRNTLLTENRHDGCEELFKKIRNSFLLRLLLLICFVRVMSFNAFNWKVVVLFFIFILVILNESIKEYIK